MQPVEIPISSKVKARVGFRDDRAEILVKIPLLGWTTLSLDPTDMKGVEEVQKAYNAWLALPEDVRRQSGAP